MTTPEEYNRIMTKRVLWKLDLHILPPLAFVSVLFVRRSLTYCLIQLWLANFIDRSNVGNAR